MKAKDFLLCVESFMPNRDALSDFGLDNDEIQEIQEIFNAPKREASDQIGLTELERMIVEYDCSKMEIGLVRFRENPTITPVGTSFAFYEADYLVVTPEGKVVWCDWRIPDEIYQVCAKDSEHFLDGLACFLKIHQDESNWKGRAKKAANQCAEAAGGAEYVRFFRSLCGFLQ